MSYDFTDLDESELIEELAVVDDRRIWKIAEAIRRDISKEYIHRITKIDRWFIDKIAILVEMEQALKTQPLTEELLLEAKGFENVIVNLTGETADVVVPDADLEDASRAQIEDIVKRKTCVAAESIVITPLSQSKNTEDTAATTASDASDTSAASAESDTTPAEDTETSADVQDGSTIDTEGIYD